MLLFKWQNLPVSIYKFNSRYKLLIELLCEHSLGNNYGDCKYSPIAEINCNINLYILSKFL